VVLTIGSWGEERCFWREVLVMKQQALGTHDNLDRVMM
jgi:hypothetical protein